MSKEGGGGVGYKEEEESCLARLVCLATSSTLKKKGEGRGVTSPLWGECSSAHSAYSLIKKSTGMLLGSWAHIQ